MANNVDTILHTLCENKKWERVLNRLDSHPAESKVRDINGDCCLHYLADLKAPLPVIIAMIKANPEAAIEQDCYHHTPIRWATQREHTSGAWKVIDVLLTSWPEHVEKLKLASEVYEGGQLLLHIAAEKGAPIDIVNKLLDIYPGASEVKVRGPTQESSLIAHAHPTHLPTLPLTLRTTRAKSRLSMLSSTQVLTKEVSLISMLSILSSFAIPLMSLSTRASPTGWS